MLDESEVSESDVSTAAPPDAYSLRDLEEQRSSALAQWTRKSAFSCAAQAVVAALMFYSPYWYMSIIAFAAVGAGVVSLRKVRPRRPPARPCRPR